MSDTPPGSSGARVNGAPPAEATTRASGPSRLVPVSRAEALRLLAGAPFGRIVFTEKALPAIRPVNHVYNGHDIIIRTREGAALTNAASGPSPRMGVVVAYEVDQIDPDTRAGWSVVVTGYAKVVVDPDETERYMKLVQPWVEGSMDVVVRITPDLVSGYRLETGA